MERPLVTSLILSLWDSIWNGCFLCSFSLTKILLLAKIFPVDNTIRNCFGIEIASSLIISFFCHSSLTPCCPYTFRMHMRRSFSLWIFMLYVQISTPYNVVSERHISFMLLFFIWIPWLSRLPKSDPWQKRTASYDIRNCNPCHSQELFATLNFKESNKYSNTY